jgi:hypothetical protein
MANGGLMRVRIVQNTAGLYELQRRTIFGNWRDVGPDELYYARLLNPVGLWVWRDEAEARRKGEALLAYWRRPLTSQPVMELPESEVTPHAHPE